MKDIKTRLARLERVRGGNDTVAHVKAILNAVRVAAENHTGMQCIVSVDVCEVAT